MDNIRQRVIKTIAGVLQEKNIEELFQKQDELKVLKFNSISFITVIVELENTFDMEFDDNALMADYFPTLTSLCEYIKQAAD